MLETNLFVGSLVRYRNEFLDSDRRSLGSIGVDGSIINNQLNSETAVSIEIETALGIR